MKKQLFLPFVLFMVLMISSCNGDKVDGLQRKVDSLNLAIKKLSVEKAKMGQEALQEGYWHLLLRESHL